MKDLKQMASTWVEINGVTVDTTGGDIDLTGGDINYNENATIQHQRDILLTNKGAMKHAPLTGVGAADFLNDDSPESIMDETRRQFLKDGMKVNAISYGEQGLEVEAYYENSNR